MKTTPRHGWHDLVAVFTGGMLGTALRLAVEFAVPHAADEFPWGTLLINVVGSLLLGQLVGTIWSRPGTPSWLRAGLGVGALGSFTTFSAVMVSAVAMSVSDDWMLAIAYLVASVVLGIGAAALGLRFGRPGTTIEVDE